jgi:uncharacterized membrane protein HdeD (DUF308 family)
LQVAVPYVVVIMGATALYALPMPRLHTAVSVVIFGPCTLVRPVAMLAAVGWAVLPDPRWQLVLVGLLVGLPAVLLEPHLDRRVVRRLLAMPPTPVSDPSNRSAPSAVSAL